MAEWLWGQEEDRREMLRLLALAVTGLGGEGLGEFVPPSERLAEVLARPAEPVSTEARRARRRAEVEAFVAAAGGEVG